MGKEKLKLENKENDDLKQDILCSMESNSDDKYGYRRVLIT